MDKITHFIGRKGVTKSKNTNLHKAKTAKNDEFYTQLKDVENELKHYKHHFKDKIVLCNCDDPTWSAFWKYFHLNFNELGLKKLISTHYDANEPTYKMEYYGEDDNDIEVGRITPLQGNGDFRNKECVDLLIESDIVVTNPPFSCYREYVKTLVEHDKKFVIWSNNNSITYKEIFPLLKNNEMWLGYTANKTLLFQIPTHYEKWDEKETAKINDGHHYAKVPAISVFTNLDIKKRHEEIILWETYTPEKFPHYDNYDAINVDKVDHIPKDYDGVMGVPITFLDKYNPEQFEIVSFRKGEDGKDLVFTREREFNRTFESLSRDDKVATANVRGWKEEVLQDINQKKIEPIDLFYPQSMAISGCMNSPKDTMINGIKKYARILIKKKNEVNKK